MYNISTGILTVCSAFYKRNSKEKIQNSNSQEAIKNQLKIMIIHNCFIEENSIR